MPGGDEDYKSFTGAVVSLSLVFLILAYAGYKMLDLVEFNDYVLQEAEQENFFPAN